MNNKALSPFATMIDMRGMSREQWLEERRKGIGGSDAAAILGKNSFKSAYTVWADKMGHSDDGDSEAARQGRDLESYVAQRFVEETGVKVARVNSILVSKEYPWMRANIDRRIVSGGAFVGLECKTSRDIWLQKFKNGEYPLEYYAQCQHYIPDYQYHLIL
ncbi:hypothetical protein AGMMS49992_22190 [Clostridia bacterium]|nr:hypothetical protein AGMMS49992_22190 [Clostridia bacterium]